MAFSNESEMQSVVRKTLGRRSNRVISNIGDGSAVVRFSRGKLVLNTTTLIEEVHFDLSYMTARELGHKSLAVALSSVAAIGAEPKYASVGVGLKQEHGDIFLGELFSGIIRLAKTLKIDIVGESTFPSPSFTMVNVTVVAQAKEKAFTPSGAKPGDKILIMDSVGASAAGLSFLKRMGRSEAYKQEEAVNAHLMPKPRIKESLTLSRLGGVTAMVDLRDGLARDLYRLTEASRVGAVVEEESIPVSKAAIKVGSMITSNPKAWALYGGEDYQLLFTAKPKSVEKIKKAMKAKRIPVSVIGEIKPTKQRVKIKNQIGDLVPFMPKLWTHYARRGKLR